VPANEDEAAARLYRQLNARKCSSYLGDPPNLVNGMSGELYCRRICSNFALQPVLKQLGNGLVCDIGSGLGRDLLGVARAYPHLRIELHDKPETMSLARDVSRAVHSRGVMYSDTGPTDVVPPSSPFCYYQSRYFPSS